MADDRQVVEGGAEALTIPSGTVKRSLLYRSRLIQPLWAAGQTKVHSEPTPRRETAIVFFMKITAGVIAAIFTNMFL